jgi:hypothetical protein
MACTASFDHAGGRRREGAGRRIASVVTPDDVWAAPMTPAGAIRTFAPTLTRERGDAMHRHLARRGRHLAAAAVAITAIGLASCGDDDDAAPAAAAAAPTTTAAPGTAAAPGGGADIAAYCDAEVDVEMAAAGLGDPDADPKAFATAMLAPAQAAAALAPADVQHPYEHRMEALQQAIAGDAEALAQAEQPEIHAFDKDNCGWEQVAVEAAEFHFTGLPETMKAGVYEFELSNVGQELHVLAIVARKPGVTDSWDELLADPDGESKTVTVVGTGAGPGETGSAVARLEPGEYLAVCPIPEGSVGETPGTGPPHFTQGMRQVVTVIA